MKKIFILLLAICSCEKVVDLNITPHNPLLVVNGNLDTDSIPSIFISHSTGAFVQDDINCISDADVLLYEDDVLLGEMILDSSNIDTFTITQDGWWNQINNEFISYYKFATNPKAGSTYSIEVNHIDY